MNEISKTIILAVVQGVTEFLPVSSSGHLSVLACYLDLREDSVLISIFLHLGTLFSVLFVYRSEIMKALKSLKFLFYIFISSIPAGLVGCAIGFSDIDDYLFNNPLFAGCGLIITSIILTFLPAKGNRNEKRFEEMKVRDAFFLGLAQMIAILPGVSRSGTTISAGFCLHFNGADSAKYSFLMFIPAVLGASFIEGFSKIDFNKENFNNEISLLILGFFISALVGYLSLRILIKYAKKREISRFRYYCFAVGLFVLAIELFRTLK